MVHDWEHLQIADSFVGHLYQIRGTLIWSLQRLPIGANFMVSVKALDDVTFETNEEMPP